MAIFTESELNDLLEEKGKKDLYDSAVDGAILGGITGASVGAVAGACVGDVASGAKIGGAVGSVAGAVKASKKSPKNTMKLRLKEDGDLADDDTNSDGYTSIEETIDINGKKYRLMTKSDEKNAAERGISVKDAVIINGKKYIYDQKSQKVYDRKHPIETLSRKTGAALGAAGGAVIGGAGGAVAGAALGTTAGSLTGAVIGSTTGGTAATRAIRKVTDIPDKISKKIKKEEFDFRTVYRDPGYTAAMNEFFDINDHQNRRIMLAINEDDQSKVLVGLTAKLYENIIDKVDDIDFGEIPLTKGEFTKLPNYTTIMDSLSTMRNLLVEYKQDTAPVDTIYNAVSNIVDMTPIWKKAYSLNVELPMVMYNTIALSIIEATSYMISMCVEYIKSPSHDTFQITIDKTALNKTKGHMVFENLQKFNDACRKGQVEKAMDYVIKENSKGFGGMEIGAGAAIAGVTLLLFCIIPIIRELIFLFYYSRVSVSEYFEAQASMLQVNAYNVENNRPDLTKEQKKNISSKQMKIAEKFRNFSNKISIDCKEAEKKASKEMATSNKKYKVEDVVDTMPDSASSALF